MIVINVCFELVNTIDSFIMINLTSDDDLKNILNIKLDLIET